MPVSAAYLPAATHLPTAVTATAGEAVSAGLGAGKGRPPSAVEAAAEAGSARAMVPSSAGAAADGPLFLEEREKHEAGAQRAGSAPPPVPRRTESVSAAEAPGPEIGGDWGRSGESRDGSGAAPGWRRSLQ